MYNMMIRNRNNREMNLLNDRFFDNFFRMDPFFDAPAFRVDVVDTVGAGDVFHGAFVAGLLQGWSVKDICRFASAVSAIKITRQGGRAGIPDMKTVQHFLETGEIDYKEIDERVKFYGRSLQYV